MTTYIGQTFRVSAQDIKDTLGIAMVAPVVTIIITNPLGAITTVTATGVGGVYSADFESIVEGLHNIRIEATSGGSTWIDERTIYIS